MQKESFHHNDPILLEAETSGRLLSSNHLEEHVGIVFNAYIKRRLFLFASQLATQVRTGELMGDE